jgi:hypothetical protein
MKRLILLTLLSTGAGAALAGQESISTCTEYKVPVVRWSPQGTDTVVCHQTVVGAWLDQVLTGNNGEKMAAFSKNLLTAIRPGDNATPGPLSAPVYKASEWLESGSTGVPGELWWGRTEHQHIFLGQESHLRLAKSNRLVPPSVWPAMQDFFMRRMMSVVQKQPMVLKPGDERFRIFPRERISYEQHAATTATFDGGLGGDGLIVPGKVSNARLELLTHPGIKGVLRFDLAIDGENRQFTIPVRAASEQEHLRATQSNDDKAKECNGSWGNMIVTATSGCIISNGAQFTEMYDATGAFFGDRASLAAVHFRLRVNSPPRNRTGATATGVIVLKAK